MVPLLQALGPKEISESTRERFFKMLGVAPLPNDGPYLQSYPMYAGGDNPASEVMTALDDEQSRIMDRPWTKADSPLAAAWLDENMKQIDLIVAATKRPRFYVALLTSGDEPGMVIAALLPVTQQAREAARALLRRAMFRIGAGKPDEAWQDLLACHRLARLADQGPFIVDGLVAIAIEGMALRGDAALARDGKLTADQARRFAAEFRKLPPMTKMADRISWAERLSSSMLYRPWRARGSGTRDLRWRRAE